MNKGGRNGRGGGRGKGRKGNSKRVEIGGNYWTMLITFATARSDLNDFSEIYLANMNYNAYQ